ncbi:MAG: AAA family ATPase, partial [Bacteroidetes bacterium]
NTQDDKGLVLLHGEPGTGKTHYIRYLTGKIDKKMIYIPSDYADKVASPQFLPLMISNPNSILIIEDAESIIESRESTGRTAAVSSLLNIADGLLSDCLNLQILCTFNTHIDNIDKALLRRGRLIANYQFNALETEKAQKLSDSLGFTVKYDKPATLSDIYNSEDKEE